MTRHAIEGLFATLGFLSLGLSLIPINDWLDRRRRDRRRQQAHRRMTLRRRVARWVRA